MRLHGIPFSVSLSLIGEVYHAVSAANGVDTTDWIELIFVLPKWPDGWSVLHLCLVLDDTRE